MNEYFQNFGFRPFLYPKHGFRDLSEIISRSNAMCGTAYVLDKSIGIYKISYEKECETLEPSPISEEPEDDLRSNISKMADRTQDDENIKSVSYETDCSEDEHTELIERFDNLRFSTDDEDNSKSDEHSDDNHHAGEISTIINHDYCNDMRSRNNKICFDSLGCDTEARECLTKENIYTPGKVVYETNEKEKKDVKGFEYELKIDSGTFTITEIMTDTSSSDRISDIVKQYTMNTLENITNTTIKDNQLENIIRKAKEDYKYLIASSFGNIYAKTLIMPKLEPSDIYIRVLNLKEKLIKGRFFAYLYNGKSFIQVLSIDSSSMCCIEGTYMIYLVKKHSKVTDRDLKILKIHSCNVISDISFRVNESL